ncbi:MAG: GNAT family N-acetyltransferase [Peptostreptococcus sp.]|uniref:GNAT family N-acetyltransferase n=1 Tax=Peptostreptococcus sp. TaxID=1262 RepID=UPI002FC890BD
MIKKINNDIRKVDSDEEGLIELLLIGDEQLDMIEKYLYKGDIFAIFKEEKMIGACVVTKESQNIYELKNISLDWKFQRLGYGQKMIMYIENYYKNDENMLIVGTGESPMTIDFYIKCGFERYSKVKNFFIDNYDHPIYEDGKQLVDMIYLKKKL